jgi:hypothetical protein
MQTAAIQSVVQSLAHVILTDHLFKSLWPPFAGDYEVIFHSTISVRTLYSGHCSGSWIPGPASRIPHWIQNPVFLVVASSPYHIGTNYRCFLPDLADFVSTAIVWGLTDRHSTTRKVVAATVSDALRGYNLKHFD